jgi:hypothetical protein
VRQRTERQDCEVENSRVDSVILAGVMRSLRDAHRENSPLRLCEVQYGKFHKHYREIRRFIWEDADPSGWSGG